MIKTLTQLKNNKTLTSLLILSSGSILAQGITFLCSFLLTRIYLPDDIGVLTYIISFATLFTTVINGRYDVKIVDAPSNDVIPLIHLACLLATISSILITNGIYIYLFISDAEPTIIKYGWFCFLILFLYGIMNVLNAFNNRKEEYKIMAKVYLYRSLAQNSIMIGLGLMNLGAGGLLTGQVSGYLFGMKQQSKSLLKEQVFQKKS